MRTLVATPRLRALGAVLRAARLERGWSLRRLSQLTGLNYVMLFSWENATRVPRVEDVSAILTGFRIGGEEREYLLDLVRHAHDPNWVEMSERGLETIRTAFREFERTAAAKFSWEPLLIPGLLQTADYARAIFSRVNLSKDEVEKRVLARLTRADVLSGSEPLNFTAFVGDQALRQPIGGNAVMLDQLRHLLMVSESENVHLHAVASDDYHLSYGNSFVLFDFVKMPPIGFVDMFAGSAFVYSDEQLTGFVSAKETLTDLALNEHDTRSLIREVITEREA
ncbi:helix-turn-helix domain-containing protein [Amycolatopsis sp. NPDC059021]|uniref:helix-turn-helix domain-containing protein n=1 Tax=Amycolatopsis sp. NPDC059021 TaxID=3346704 RepID=UPI00367266D0